MIFLHLQNGAAFTKLSSALSAGSKQIQLKPTGDFRQKRKEGKTVFEPWLQTNSWIGNTIRFETSLFSKMNWTIDAYLIHDSFVTAYASG